MRPSPLPTIVLASGLALALAQSNTACRNQRYNDRATFSRVNATGTTPFTWNTTDSKPWHMSVQVNQTGDMSDNGSGTVGWPYLSVPDGVRGNACVYAFGSMNQTATDGSCGGVFPDECSKHLLDKVRESSRRASGASGECELWIETSEEQDRVHEMCGFTNDRALKSYVNISNKTCAIPALSGVDLPPNYVTQRMELNLSPFNSTIHSNWDGIDDTAYDLLTVQSIAFAVVWSRVLEGDQVQTDAQLVCVTPNSTQRGSRFVGNKTPWEDKKSLGVSVAWGAGQGVSAVVAGVVVALLW